MGELSYTVGGDSNLVSFKSAARVPITSLKAHFKPKQDLHGYSKPWPAGGGKNLIGNNFITGKTISYSGEIVTNTNGTISDYINVSSVSYVWSGINNHSDSWNYRIHGYNENKEWIKEIAIQGVNKDSSYNIVFTPDSNTKYIRLSFNVQTNNNQIEKGPTATSYEPYENICPIEGWTECEIYKSGFNLFDEEYESGGLNDSTGSNYSDSSFIRSKNYIPCKPNTSYCFSYTHAEPYVANLHVYYYDINKQHIRNTWITPKQVVTSHSRAYYMRFYMDSAYKKAGILDVSINYPSTDTEYHSFGEHIPVTFPTIGKNLFNLDTATTDAFIRADNVSSENPLGQIVYDRQYYVASDFISVLPSTTYTAHHPFHSIAPAAGMVYYDANKIPISGVSIYVQLLNNEENDNNYTFTTPDNCYYVRISYDSRTGNEFQLEQGNTATAYEPYSPDNTFYGGYIDPAAGEAQPTWYLYTITGDEEFLDDNNNNAWVSAFAPSGMWASNETSLIQVGYCTHYPYAAYTKGKIGVMYNERTITFDASIRDAAGWKAFCKAEYEKGTPVQICYPLKSYSQSIPIKKNNITTFINTNNIWSNTNSNTEVSYAIHDTAPIRATKKLMAAENDKHYRKVLWNQMAGPMTSQYWERYNTSATSVEFTDDYAEVTVDQIRNYGYEASIRTSNDIVVFTNHYYYASYMVCPSYNGNFSMEFAGGHTIGNHTAAMNEWTRFSSPRYNGFRNGGGKLYIPYFVNGTYQVGDKAKVKNVIYIDLTKMFGMGNEPTKAEFEKLCAINNIDLTAYHPIDSGTEQIWCIPGHDTNDYTVVNWNQRGKEVNSSNYRAYNSNYIDVTFEDNAIVSTWLSEGSEYLYSVCANYNRTHTLGNYFYLSYEYYTDIDGYIGGDVGGETTTYKRTTINQWTRYSDIKQRTTSGNFTNAVVYVNRFNETVKPKAGNYCKARNIIAIDLTQMFGAGNEPTTVAELRETCLKNNINLDEAQPYTTGATMMWKK